MAMTKDILIFGSTGVIGIFITQALIDAKSTFGRLAVFTSPATLEKKAAQVKKLQEQGVEIISGDVTNESDVQNAYNKGFDTIVSALGRAAIAEQILLLRLAEQTPSIKRFFPSEYGTDIEYFPNSKDEIPHQQKLKVRKYIADHVKRLEYTYLVTGPYADMYIRNWKGGEFAGSYDVETKKATLLGDGKGRIALTSMRDVGRLLVGAVHHPVESRNRALKVNSFTTTPDEILAEFEKQTGGEKWNTSYTPLDKLKEGEQKLYEEKNPAATAVTLRRIWTEGGTLYDKTDNESIGVTKTDSLGDVVAKAIAAS